MNWPLNFSLSPHPHHFFLGNCWSHMRLVPNSLQLAYTIWPEPSSIFLLFSAISKGSGETVRMCRLAWSFAARICKKIPKSRTWYKQFGQSLHLISSFSAISYKGSGETVWMCRLACCFAARICDKYLNHMNWPMKFGLSLHLHPFFLGWFAKALARLRKCAASPDHSLLAYVIFFMNWS